MKSPHMTEIWKKKRYDIHIRLTPDDIKSIEWACWNILNLTKELTQGLLAAKYFEDVVWRIHNKCVEINRK